MINYCNYCVNTLALNKLKLTLSGAAPGCRHGPGRRCGNKETIAGLLAESPPWVPVKKQRHYVHAASPPCTTTNIWDVRNGFFYQDGEALKIVALNKYQFMYQQLTGDRIVFTLTRSTAAEANR
jgi:hypothetical protein